MNIDLTSEEINFIYNTLKSGIFIPDSEKDDPFTLALRNKFLLHNDIGKNSEDVRP